MKTIHLTHTIDLPVRADRAWALIADYPRDPEWRTGVLSMTASPDGEARVGTVTVEELRFGGTTYRNVGEIVAVERGRSLRWRTTEGADADGSRAVEARADGTCRVTLELNVRPTGLERVLSPVLAVMLARNLRQDLARLRALLERDLADAAAA